MTKNRKSLKGIRVPTSKCECGAVIRGFWCKDISYYDVNEKYICNKCYDEKIKPVNRIVKIENEHITLWRY